MHAIDATGNRMLMCEATPRFAIDLATLDA